MARGETLTDLAGFSREVGGLVTDIQAAGDRKAKLGLLEKQDVRAEKGEARTQQAFDIGLEDKKEERRHSEASNDILGRMINGLKDGESTYLADPGATGFNAKDENAASILFADYLMSQEKNQTALSKMHKTRSDAQFQKINQHLSKAQQFATGDDRNYGAALHEMELGYELHMDGYDIQYGDDAKSMAIIDKLTGQVISKSEFASPQAMYEEMRKDVAALEGKDGQDNYFRKYNEANSKRMKVNAENVSNAEYLRAPDGTYAKRTKVVDENYDTKIIYEIWDDGGSLGTLTEEQGAKINWTSTDEAIKRQQLAKEKALTTKAGVTDLKSASPEEKLAVGIMRMFANDPALSMNQAQAMEWVLNNKMVGTKVETITRKLQESKYRQQGIDHPDIKAMIRALDVGAYFGQVKGQTGAAGGLIDVKAQSQARKNTRMAAKTEKRKVGKTKTADFTKKEQESMQAEANKMKADGMTNAKIEEALRNKYAK
jgi:hypothetical protein